MNNLKIFSSCKTMIRYGKEEDLKQIDEFDKFGGDHQKEIIEQRLQVYISDSRVTGYVSIINHSCLFGHPLITFLCVHPRYRRQRIASRLLLEVEQKNSNRQLFISTESNNLIMLSLIMKRGYIKSGNPI